MFIGIYSDIKTFFFCDFSKKKQLENLVKGSIPMKSCSFTNTLRDLMFINRCMHELCTSHKNNRDY